MAFSQSTFVRQENIGLRESLTLYNYKTNDPVALVTSPEYFSRNPRYDIKPDDIVLASCGNGFYILRFTSSSTAEVAISDSGGGGGDFVIVETTAPYTMTGNEDVVAISGGGDVNFLAVSSATKAVNLYADGGDVTPVFAGTETTNQAIVTTGNSAYYCPLPSKNAWDAI